MRWLAKRSLDIPLPHTESVLEEVPVSLSPPVFPPPQPVGSSPTKIARGASIANRLRPRLDSANNNNGGAVALWAESSNSFLSSALLAFVSGGIGKPGGGCIIARFRIEAGGFSANEKCATCTRQRSPRRTTALAAGQEKSNIIPAEGVPVASHRPLRSLARSHFAPKVIHLAVNHVLARHAARQIPPRTLPCNLGGQGHQQNWYKPADQFRGAVRGKFPSAPKRRISSPLLIHPGP
jgi:hypothetical protein